MARPAAWRFHSLWFVGCNVRMPIKSKAGVARRQVSQTHSMPPPVGGWNARDPVARMPDTDAVIMENMYPRTVDVALRPGSVDWATGMGSNNVESLFAYNKANGSSQVFAVAGGSAYDVTAQGAVGAAVWSGKTNSRWEYVNFGTPGGSFLYAVNGEDSPMYYDGTTWVAVTGASSPAIAGVTTSDLAHVNAHKNRLWFVQKNSLKAWYLPVQSIGGAAAGYDLQSLFTLGGYLVAMGTWTLDAGYGVDDHAVFITSEGEAAVFRGTDPSSSATWEKIGVFQLGRPINRRCFCKYGGDLLLMLNDGLVPLSKELQSSRLNPKVALTDKIQYAISEAVTLYKSHWGWQVFTFSEANAVIINVPTGSSSSYQAMMNTVTGAWCKLTDWNALCWVETDAGLFYGGTGKVVNAWVTNLDNSSNINARVLQAFSYLGRNSQQKHVKMARPTLSISAEPSILLGVNADFDQTAPTGTFTTSPASAGMVWGSMVWGSMVWGGSTRIENNWKSTPAIGYALAMQMKIQNNASQVYWQATDYLYENGGVL